MRVMNVLSQRKHVYPVAFKNNKHSHLDYVDYSSRSVKSQLGGPQIVPVIHLFFKHYTLKSWN